MLEFKVQAIVASMGRFVRIRELVHLSRYRP